MMQELKQQFNIIIIDAPPVGAVSDAQILGDYSDVSLYLVRQNYTIKDSLEVVNDIVENTKLPNVYLVINDVKNHSSYKYDNAYNHGRTDQVDTIKKKVMRKKFKNV